MRSIPAPDVDRVLSGVLGAHARIGEVPALAGAVVDPRGVVAAAWGHASNVNTVFRIASMTKSFTAVAVLQLRDRGILALDTPVVEYAPELASVRASDVSSPAITLRHLLSMSSGLATDDAWADRQLHATDDDFDNWLQQGLRFAYGTGTAFEYSNLGYALIGRVVHRVTGSRLQQHITEQILRPLNMHLSVWQTSALPDGADVAAGWHRVGNRLVEVPPLADGVLAPMGGLWSCVDDLATWIGFLASAFGPTPTHADVLSSASRREMQQLQRATIPIARTAVDGTAVFSPGGYGFGIALEPHDELGDLRGHSGGLPGYGSNMRWVPGGHGVVALGNCTYARMADTNSALLDALVADGVALGGQPVLADGLYDTASRLVGLLGSWDDDAASALFSENVVSDQSFAERAEAAAAIGITGLVAVHGTGAAGANATVTTGKGTLAEVEFELWPLGGARIQRYEVRS